MLVRPIYEFLAMIAIVSGIMLMGTFTLGNMVIGILLVIVGTLILYRHYQVSDTNSDFLDLNKTV